MTDNQTPPAPDAPEQVAARQRVLDHARAIAERIVARVRSAVVDRDGEGTITLTTDDAPPPPSGAVPEPSPS